MSTNTRYESHQPNWLPLPFEPAKSRAAVTLEDDLFAKGEILEFYPKQKDGVLKNTRSELISFNVTQIEFVGPKNNAAFLEAGMMVGYDLARTSHGPLINKIKIY